MEEMDIISELNNCLLQFEYPLANTMDAEQLADIFNRSNRCFLISWIINLLSTACGNLLQNMENTEEYLGNLLFTMGFCGKKESIPFIRGELALTSQLEIIQKMFNCLKRASQSVAKVDITHEEIEHLKTMNMNLFPNYGDIRSANTKDNIDLKKIIHSSNNDVTELKVCPEKLGQDIETLFMKVKAEFPDINKMRTLEKNRAAQTKETIIFTKKFPEILTKCNAHLTIINKFFADLRIISKFSSYDLKNSNENSTNHEWRKIMQNLQVQFTEVLRYSSVKE